MDETIPRGCGGGEQAERAGAKSNIIERMLKPQWSVDCNPLAQEAIKVSRCSPVQLWYDAL